MVLTYQDIESVIDPEQERDAIVKLLDTYWNVRVAAGKTVGGVVDCLLQEGIKVGIATQETITEETVKEYNERYVLMFSRIDLKGIPETIPFTNTTKGSEYDFYKKPGQFEFEDNLIKKVEQEFRLRGVPKGYQRALSNERSGGRPAWEPLPFEGTDLHFSPYGPPCITHSLAPAGVARRKTCSIVKSSREILIFAVYHHGHSIGRTVVDQKYSKLGHWLPELKERLGK